MQVVSQIDALRIAALEDGATAPAYRDAYDPELGVYLNTGALAAGNGDDQVALVHRFAAMLQGVKVVSESQSFHVLPALALVSRCDTDYIAVYMLRPVLTLCEAEPNGVVCPTGEGL